MTLMPQVKFNSLFVFRVMPYPRMSDFYINYYGDDMNDYSVYMPDMMKPYDERDFRLVGWNALVYATVIG